MNYYPIGTVVTLIGGDRPLMIYGRKQKQQTTGITWDYVACLYPEGNLDEDKTVFFQNEEIENVLFTGYISEFETRMQDILNAGAKGVDP
ncbi:MAG TPA: DUF4176 domain-containing protein [Oscillospiraceae bacterium]|jgi:hypothetical protein|nr:DUF4176 domain-containing protein [Oscillospiraceae bacterium]